MEPMQCIPYIGDYIYSLAVKSRRATSTVLKEARKWMVEPLKTEKRFHLITKLLFIAVGTAFMWFFGWSGVALAQAGITAAIQGNKLSAKQICSSANLTVGDRLWCDDFNHDVPLSTIVNHRDWVAVSASTTKTWLRSKFATFSLCGTYSLAERSGDTCISLGVMLGLYFLTRSSSLDKHFRPALLRDYVAPILALFTDYLGETYFDIAISLVHVFVFTLIVGTSIADNMLPPQRVHFRDDVIFTVLTTGLVLAAVLYVVIWTLRAMYYHPGQCLFFVAVIGFAIWRGSRVEWKSQTRALT